MVEDNQEVKDDWPNTQIGFPKYFATAVGSLQLVDVLTQAASSISKLEMNVYGAITSYAVRSTTSEGEGEGAIYS